MPQICGVRKQKGISLLIILVSVNAAFLQRKKPKQPQALMETPFLFLLFPRLLLLLLLILLES